MYRIIKDNSFYSRVPVKNNIQKELIFKQLLIPEGLMGTVIGKGHQNFNTIETMTGVTLKLHGTKLYMKAESKKSEKLAVREIKKLAVGIFDLKNSAKLRNIVTEKVWAIIGGKYSAAFITRELFV